MKRVAAALALCLVPLPSLGQSLPTPASVLGFRVGEDRKLADWTQIVDYFRKLDAASPRVAGRGGRKDDGRPPVPGGHDHLRGEHGAPGGDPPRPTCAWPIRAGCRERGGRAASSTDGRDHRGPQPRHPLDRGRGAADRDGDGVPAGHQPRTRGLLEILDRTVIVMLPSHNPDGTQKVTEWYRKSLGTPWEGGASLPFLYHKYVGHDNNRDWYMFTQVESRLTVQPPLRPLAAADRPRPAPDGRARRRASSCRRTSIPGSPTSTPR